MHFISVRSVRFSCREKANWNRHWSYVSQSNIIIAKKHEIQKLKGVKVIHFTSRIIFGFAGLTYWFAYCFLWVGPVCSRGFSPSGVRFITASFLPPIFLLYERTTCKSNQFYSVNWYIAAGQTVLLELARYFFIDIRINPWKWNSYIFENTMGYND